MSLPRAKKSFGQNFLVDRSVLRKIISAADITPGETVLEIGPGTGILTEALVNAGAHVIAVEADQDLIPALREKFGDRITLVEGDILEIDLSQALRQEGREAKRVSPAAFPPAGLPASYKLVANIPYNITSAILEQFLTSNHPPSRMVLMVQNEVADRIVGWGGKMSLLSVVCQTYAEVAKVAKVAKGAFRPIPKVDSAIVSLVHKPQTTNHHPESTIALAKIGFSHPRKQLHGNLSAAGIAPSAAIKAVLTEIGLPSTARAETVTVDQWKRMRDLL